MKNQPDILLLATFGGGLIFNYLFWREGQALNLLLYTVFILAAVLAGKEIQKSRKVYLTGAAHLFTALLVVFNASDLCVVSWYLSLAVFVGFVHFQALRSIFAALAAALLQVFSTPVNIGRRLIGTRMDKLHLSPLLKPVKYLVIPFLVLIIFSVLYSHANPVFARYQLVITSHIGLAFENIFNFFFADLSFERFLHLVLGILLTGAILIGFRDKALETAELACGEQLQRKKGKNGILTIGQEIAALFAGGLMGKKMALKTENTIGIICFILLNLLLLFLNMIDATTLWQRVAADPAGQNFSAELHDGTNALIISIVLAMLVILYFFNGNLNFYSKNRTLRMLAYAWIIQNTFLTASVLLRDYHYIAAHGLTYKRIGVLVFLLLCAFGLATVYIKVARQKTVFYLLRVNTLTWYLLLIGLSAVNWDVFIIGYNIRHRNEISLDLEHIKSLSDKTLPLLWENRESLKGLDAAFEKSIQHRIGWFKKTQAQKSWLSWNYQDWRTSSYVADRHL